MAKSAKTSTAPAIVWFRDDLRLGDNPALYAAVESGGPVLAVYIFDEETKGLRAFGGASRWWLHHALHGLGQSLKAHGAALHLFRGASHAVLTGLVAETGALSCFWNRRYGAKRALDDTIAADVEGAGVTVRTFNGSLLREPDEVRTKTGGTYRVFTPYMRASLDQPDPHAPLQAPKAINGASLPEGAGAITLEALNLLPKKPDWAGGLRETWTPGEDAAHERLADFLDGPIESYDIDRDRPAVVGTSRLSPHLRFGEISPRAVFAAAQGAAQKGEAPRGQVRKFLQEIVWRDFAYSLLSAHPDLATEAYDRAFIHFPYGKPSEKQLEAWRFGHTGYPIVDAGMRQLWRTGVMHNRVRMIAASFLIKHLLIDWRIGEAWFWDTLCDADPANNPFNWQWVAGSGADASPYFRIFNPILQGRKFDPDGDYVRQFVPELDKLPARHIHEPWAAPKAVLDEAGVVLDKTYPRPIVDHDEARARALAALGKMRAVSKS